MGKKKGLPIYSLQGHRVRMADDRRPGAAELRELNRLSSRNLWNVVNV